MKHPCMVCKNSGNCERENTPWVRDIVSRGHSRCGDYEPKVPDKKRRRMDKNL